MNLIHPQSFTSDLLDNTGRLRPGLRCRVPRSLRDHKTLERAFIGKIGESAPQERLEKNE